MGKILKDSHSEDIEVHSLSTFRSVDKGTKSFSVQTFSTVEVGTSEYDYKDLEKAKEKKPVPPVETPIQPKEEASSDKDEADSAISLEQFEETLNKEKEVARQAGYDDGFAKGMAEAKLQFEKAYEAQRQDYLSSMTSQMGSARAELIELKNTVTAFDEEIPALVIGFVKEIVGAERKLNDEIITSVVQESLSRIKGMEEITLIINPADEDIVKEQCPGYPVEHEAAVSAGSFKVKTRIGEIDFSIETMIRHLEKSINEKFTTPEDS